MKKSKVIITLFMSMIVLLVSSISVSLAWYANSLSLYVNTFDIDLRTERDLLISTQKDDLDLFEHELKPDDLKQVDYFEPVSSMFMDAWTDDKNETPIFYSGYSSLANSFGIPNLKQANKGFYSQELYLYSDDNVWVSLQTEESYMVSDHEKNIKTAESLKDDFPELTAQEICQNLDNIQNCLRMSILIPDEEWYDYKIVDPYKSGTTLLGGRLDNDLNGYYDFYHANDGQRYEIMFGEVANRDNLVYKAPNSSNAHTGVNTCFNADSYENVYVLDVEASLENGVSIAEEETISWDEVNYFDEGIAIPVIGGEVRKIVLSFYLEGWDLDNIDTTMKASFNVLLKFKILREMIL